MRLFMTGHRLMPTKLQRQEKARRSMAIKKQEVREVSVDDVIKHLLDLFDHLDVDAGLLAARFTHLKSTKSVSKRIYPYIAAIGELLTSWHQDPNYLDRLGPPLALRIE